MKPEFASLDLPSGWCTYMLIGTDGSYYVGLTHDLRQRILDHSFGKGPTYTKLTKPKLLVWFESTPPSRSRLRTRKAAQILDPHQEARPSPRRTAPRPCRTKPVPLSLLSARAKRFSASLTAPYSRPILCPPSPVFYFSDARRVSCKLYEFAQSLPQPLSSPSSSR